MVFEILRIASFDNNNVDRIAGAAEEGAQEHDVKVWKHWQNNAQRVQLARRAHGELDAQERNSHPPAQPQEDQHRKIRISQVQMIDTLS